MCFGRYFVFRLLSLLPRRGLGRMRQSTWAETRHMSKGTPVACELQRRRDQNVEGTRTPTGRKEPGHDGAIVIIKGLTCLFLTLTRPRSHLSARIRLAAIAAHLKRLTTYLKNYKNAQQVPEIEPRVGAKYQIQFRGLVSRSISRDTMLEDFDARTSRECSKTVNNDA